MPQLCQTPVTRSSNRSTSHRSGNSINRSRSIDRAVTGYPITGQSGQPVSRRVSRSPVSRSPAGHRPVTGHRPQTGQPVTGQPVNRSVDRSVTGHRSRTGQPVNRSVDRSVTGDRSPVSQSTGQPVNRAAGQPDIQSPPVSRSSPVNRSKVQWTSHPTGGTGH